MTSTVFIVDDDDAFRQGLSLLLRTAGFQVEAFGDGREFLAAITDDRRGCVVLDVAMPSMSGLEVNAALKARGLAIPVVFLTGHGDIPMTVRAVKAGAVDFLEKPIIGKALIRRIRRALAVDEDNRRTRAAGQSVADRYARLTDREREVMTLVVGGLASKEIAKQLDISVRTVEAHRTHIMAKMAAGSLAELVHMAAHCNIEPPSFRESST